MHTLMKAPNICDNIGTSGAHLTFAKRDVTALAARYATPLYLLDENKIRENCRIYLTAMRETFGEDALPLYAGKALCIKDIYRIIREEGLGIDVVSAGEIMTAVRGGFDMKNAYFHGNGKTDADIALAMDYGVGYFVCDNEDELCAIEAEASKRGITQKILLRVSPGIDPHTHAAISTGKVDSKFGAAIETGDAEAVARRALSLPHIALVGLHCHIGSQIFESTPFLDACRIMITFMAQLRTVLGVTLPVLNLGGGMGVRYIESHETVDYAAVIKEIGCLLRSLCKTLDYPMPRVHMEPGRSIVANAGMTLYTAQTVKEIKGFKSYLAIDGGMPDNPRYALYEAPYTVLSAARMDEPRDFVCTVAGRCCESGDLIQEAVSLPRPVRGDLIAVLTTGAYNYSMASNYNRIPRPAMILLTDDGEKTVVRRETYEDLLSHDM